VQREARYWPVLESGLTTAGSRSARRTCSGGAWSSTPVWPWGASTAICRRPDGSSPVHRRGEATVPVAVPRVWNRHPPGVGRWMLTKPRAIRWMFEYGDGGKNKQRQGRVAGAHRMVAFEARREAGLPEGPGGLRRPAPFCRLGRGGVVAQVAEFIENMGIRPLRGYGIPRSSGGTTAQPVGAKRLGRRQKAPGWRSASSRQERRGRTADTGRGRDLRPRVMSGYHNLDDATARPSAKTGAFAREIWGAFDADGYLYITGRPRSSTSSRTGSTSPRSPLRGAGHAEPLHVRDLRREPTPHVALIVPDMAALRAWAKKKASKAMGRPAERLQSPQAARNRGRDPHQRLQGLRANQGLRHRHRRAHDSKRMLTGPR